VKQQLFSSRCHEVTFHCARCGRVKAHLSLAGVIVRKRLSEIVAFVADAHERQHQEEDRANGANHS